MKPVEVIMRTERRRKFSEAFRRRIVLETENPDVTIISVAEKYDLAQSLVHKWRTKYLSREIIYPLDEAIEAPRHVIASGGAPASPDFIYAGQLGPEIPAPRPAEGKYLCPNACEQRIEIILPTGFRLSVSEQFNETTLLRVMRVLGSGS